MVFPQESFEQNKKPLPGSQLELFTGSGEPSQVLEKQPAYLEDVVDWQQKYRAYEFQQFLNTTLPSTSKSIMLETYTTWDKKEIPCRIWSYSSGEALSIAAHIKEIFGEKAIGHDKNGSCITASSPESRTHQVKYKVLIERPMREEYADILGENGEPLPLRSTLRVVN